MQLTVFVGSVTSHCSRNEPALLPRDPRFFRGGTKPELERGTENWDYWLYSLFAWLNSRYAPGYWMNKYPSQGGNSLTMCYVEWNQEELKQRSKTRSRSHLSFKVLFSPHHKIVIVRSNQEFRVFVLRGHWWADRNTNGSFFRNSFSSLGSKISAIRQFPSLPSSPSYFPAYLSPPLPPLPYHFTFMSSCHAAICDTN